MASFQKDALDCLTRCEAVIENSHIVYAAGRHGSKYINKDAVFSHPKETNAVAVTMAHLIAEQYDQKNRVGVIVGPAVGGAILSQLVAFALHGRGIPVRSAFADKKTDNTFELRRGYDRLCVGQNVIVVEDILTTGGSVRKVVEAVSAVGGKVTGVAAIINRGKVTADMLGVTWFRALANITLDSWSADECPLCRDGVPINTAVGKGREFLAAQSR